MLEPMLQLQSAAGAAQRPAVERLCTDIATSAIACGLLQLDLALQITARARLLAQSVNIPSMSVQVEHTLAYVSLSVGDSELAIEKLQLVTRDNQQAGKRSPTITYNLLLTLAVAECYADAQALAARAPVGGRPGHAGPDPRIRAAAGVHPRAAGPRASRLSLAGLADAAGPRAHGHAGREHGLADRRGPCCSWAATSRPATTCSISWPRPTA